jgi:hypothetical protein
MRLFNNKSNGKNFSMSKQLGNKSKVLRTRILASALMFVALLLSACGDKGETAYLYGPAKSCYRNASISSARNCNTLSPYDRLLFQVNREGQSVTFLQQGLKLDETNTIFRNLENCSVIDEENFSCDGLKQIDKEFVNTEVFGDKVISISYWGYLYSSYSNGITKETLGILNNYNSWIKWGVAIFGVLILLGLIADS